MIEREGGSYSSAVQPIWTRFEMAITLRKNMPILVVGIGSMNELCRTEEVQYISR